ncbi:MAG TPA: hypothetical protein VLM85_30640 [Polyangiaceae bacterium]|nr:hypothetical protein [Polyangiaceae bacterium]
MRNAVLRSSFGVAFVALSLSCGGGAKQQEVVTPAVAPVVSVDAIEKDPAVLFPSSALAMFTVDAHAFYGSPTAGPQAARLAERYFPVGAEVGFSASRDLDRATSALYSTSGADALAILVGRFDEAKIGEAAKAKTATKAGVIVQSTYANRTLYTLSNVGFTVLSPHLVLAGTETSIRRALDRLRDGKTTRDAPAWMLQTLGSPGAAAAAAVDLKAFPPNTFSGLPIKGMNGITALRLLGNFQPPGMHVAGSVTYVDAQHAKTGAEGLQSVLQSPLVGMTLGIQLRDVKVQPAQSDAQVSFSLDDSSLQGILSRLPSMLGG